MVSRSMLITLVVTGAVLAAATWTAARFIAPATSCPTAPNATQSRQTRDFFKASPAPMTGGQEMRPRW